MKDIIDRLVRFLVFQARVYEQQAERLLDPKNPEGVHANHRRGHTGFTFLALYLTRHPANPYFRDPAALDLYQRIVRVWVDGWAEEIRKTGQCDSEEWRPFIVCRGIELVGREMDPGLRRDAERVIRRWVETELKQPLFFTAPNHEMWKFMVAALAGRIFRRPDWRRQAEFEVLQMLRYQTPEGFWEEGRHHGPSMAYNFVMLGPLALLAKELGNRRIRDAAIRLARFMTTWMFPDGARTAALDGRTGLGLGMVVPGLDRVPEGVTLLRRLLKPWEDAGWFDPARRDTPIYPLALDGAFLSAEALLQLGRAGKGRPPTPMVFDARRAQRENHTPYFDAVMARRGPWVVALSSQLSDVPKDTQFIYRLERQNRIDVWHERASVVIGGGHSLVTAAQPLYNAWVEPGYHLDPSEYSKTNDEAGSPAMARRRSKYYPRWADSGIRGNAAWLELGFGHATVRFELEPEGRRLTIRYTFECVGLEELRLCLPLVVWHPGGMLLEGKTALDDGKTVERAVHRCVAAEDSFHGTKTTLFAPASGRTLFRYPVDFMRSYTRSFVRDKSVPLFRLGQMETVWRSPARKGKGEWGLEVCSL